MRKLIPLAIMCASYSAAALADTYVSVEYLDTDSKTNKAYVSNVSYGGAIRWFNLPKSDQESIRFNLMDSYQSILASRGLTMDLKDIKDPVLQGLVYRSLVPAHQAVEQFISGVMRCAQGGLSSIYKTNPTAGAQEQVTQCGYDTTEKGLPNHVYSAKALSLAIESLVENQNKVAPEALFIEPTARITGKGAEQRWFVNSNPILEQFGFTRVVCTKIDRSKYKPHLDYSTDYYNVTCNLFWPAK